MWILLQLHRVARIDKLEFTGAFLMRLRVQHQQVQGADQALTGQCVQWRVKRHNLVKKVRSWEMMSLENNLRQDLQGLDGYRQHPQMRRERNMRTLVMQFSGAGVNSVCRQLDTEKEAHQEGPLQGHDPDNLHGLLLPEQGAECSTSSGCS